MLTDKELQVLLTIEKFIKENYYAPTIRELCQLLNYKSTKTIHDYLKKLCEKKMIKINHQQKRNIVLVNNYNQEINVINDPSKLKLSIEPKHIVFKIKNDYFTNLSIKKNDYLIIDTSKKPRDNELGLFILNKEYRIMLYHYQNGYHILQDKEQEILHKIQIVGKVIGVYRKK